MRVNSRWLAALLFLAILPLSGCTFISKLKAGNNLNKGVKAFTETKYSDAVMYFQKSIELDPDIEEAHVYLATAYMQQYVPGSLDPKNEEFAHKAIKTFSDVVDMSEEKGKPNINAMLAIASLTYNLKDIDQTRKWCTRVLNLNATTPEEKDKQAEAHYRIAVMLFDTVHEKTGIIGEKVSELGQEEKDQLLEYIQEGLDHLASAIEMNPRYFDAMMYQNLMWREKEKLIEDEQEKKDLIKMADRAYANAVKLKLEVESEEAAAHKTLGGE